MNYRMITHTLGKLLVFESGFLLLPAATAAIYGEWHALSAFLVTALACLLVGGLMSFKKPLNSSLYAKDGFVIVSLSWIVLSLFGAIPFVISGAVTNYLDALFEIVSGFTTTGASIISSVEDMPRAILMWRSFSNWIGGMGILVFVMVFLRLGGGQNVHIMKAESPGPSVSKLVPKVRSTALLLYTIYSVFTVTQMILLITVGKLDLFSAVNLSFATAGTGGFGILNDSFASYSPAVQIITAVFLVLFSLNFGSYFLILRGRFKDAFTEEIRAFLVIVAVSVTLISLDLRGIYETFGEAFRHAFFNFASIISTAGFMSSDFDLWPAFSKAILITAMFIGACAGSTGGGIKISRILIMAKTMLRELSAAIKPRQIKKITIDGQAQPSHIVRSVFGYLICLIIVFVSSVILVSLDGNDFATNFSAVAATIGNIGPGFAKVGPTQNFAFFSPVSKIVLIFDMLAGRLEFFPMLLLFFPQTWKK